MRPSLGAGCMLRLPLALLALLLLMRTSGAAARARDALVPFTVAAALDLPRHSHLECTASLDWRARRCLVRGLAYIRASQEAAGAHLRTPEWFVAGEPSTNVPQPLVPRFYDVPLSVGMLPGSAPPFCTMQNTIVTPVVLAARDEPSPWHLLVVQLLPVFSALRAFGLAEEERFQVVLLDGGRDYSYQVYDLLSGGRTVSIAELPPVFCAARAVLGAQQAELPLNKHRAVRADEVKPRHTALVADYATWVMRRAGVLRAADTMRPANMTIVTRTASGNRRARYVTGLEVLAARAEDMGLRAGMYDFAEMPFRQQLQVIGQTSIFVTVHGAACTLLAFLPPGAVFVELKPYKFNNRNTHYDIYTNWARLAGVRHLVWHNTDPFLSSVSPTVAVDDYKNHNTHLSDGAAEVILALAVAELEALAGERSSGGGPMFINSAKDVDDFQHNFG